ncbi:class III lanthionine synthetase LanKC [Streptomyces sp. NPDC006739]|uniref:class III lanthionine synthetase LanKC n=1 Tax=Streptomyces sp. NPDC006739 TaxID=3364763 RepID=UPI0036781562
MLDTVSEAFADERYYAPLATIADPGPLFLPARVPPGRQARDQDIWKVWDTGRPPGADQGWKIHVSAPLERAQHVLDVVADICFAEDVPFKHVAARFFFLVLHHKHAHRAQSGKFCAVYPPDTETARRLLDLLSEALHGEEGPYVLSDRRYRDSRTVHYRYGAFSGRSRLLPDGTREGLVRDGSGREVADLRRPAFLLPDGITDPFVTERPAGHQGPILIRDYEILKVLQPSNAGGTYTARDTRTGRTVFIKEARAHNGLTWDGRSARERLRHEHEVLALVHRAAPGLCPEPLDHFTEWEHDFLVTEFVPGDSLRGWISRTSPIVRAGRTAEDFAGYFDDCRLILGHLEGALDRLHRLGYRFGDVSLGNVLVTPNGDARLVDFESVSALSGPPAVMGTAGFTPPPELVAGADDPLLWDRYGMSAVALALLAPFHGVAQRAPANLNLLRRDLTAMGAAPPADLWARATVFHRSGRDGSAGRPTPAEVDADPLGCLARLADQVTAGLLDMADTSGRDPVFPPSPEAFRTNTVCVAYGTAGVVHALHRAGRPVPEAVEKRLLQDALAGRDRLPPGLNVGSAGIARVLAALGHLDEALDLARTADSHPLTGSCTTLAGGRAGVGLTWLALHHRTGDPGHLERAAAAGDAILGTADLAATLGEHDARGLFHGRSGPALFLHYLARDTGDDRYREAGRRLLHEELDRAILLDDGTRSFSDNAVIRRALPYLAVGAAGVGTVLARYVATSPDERCAAALPGIVAGTRMSCAMEPGLYPGVAGVAYFLADHAELSGSGADRQDAVRIATGLLKYAVPHRRGVRFLGAGQLRFSADLASGGAGVLLALHRVLHGPGDELFTLDHPRPAAGHRDVRPDDSPITERAGDRA